MHGTGARDSSDRILVRMSDGRLSLVGVLGALLVVVGVLGSPAPARAATVACQLLPPLDAVVAAAPIVFVGTVTAIPAQAGELPATVVFKVDEVWRGATVPAVVTVQTNLGGVPVTYRIGETYLVVPQPSGSVLIDTCTATRELRSEHLQLRPPGAHRPDGSPLAPVAEDDGGLVLLGAAMTGLSLLTLLVMMGGGLAVGWKVPLPAWVAASGLAIAGAGVIVVSGLPRAAVAEASPTASSSGPSASMAAPPGEVLVEVTFLTGFATPDSQRVVVTEDGLLVEAQSGTFVQRRLGTNVLAALRAALFESGTFDQDANLFGVPLAGVSEPAHDGGMHDIVVHHPDGEARIIAVPFFLGADAYEPNPALEDAVQLATSLHVNRLPFDINDWEGATTPYLASSYRLQASRGAFGGELGSANLAGIDWPLDRQIDEIGPAVERHPMEGTFLCTEISAVEAASLLSQVQLQGVALGASASTRADFMIHVDAPPTAYSVILTPLLPGDEACTPLVPFEGPVGPPAMPDLAAGATAEVRVDDLRVRAAPTTAAEVLGRVVRGDHVEVIGGPSEADGFAWFEVAVGATSGWVATGSAGDPWLLPTQGRAEFMVLRFETCALGCTEIIWYAGATSTEARLVSRSFFPGGPAEEANVRVVTLREADELLADLLGSGLLEESATHPMPELRAGAEPCLCGEVTGYTFVVRRDDAIIVVSWAGPPEPQLYEAQPEAQRLGALAERLSEAFSAARSSE